MHKFEYIKGSAKTKIPWHRPNPNLLNAWREKVFQIKDIEKYQLWICGGAIENWKTWDTDILVTGDIVSYDTLDKILTLTTQIGFDHKQLIDINYNNDLLKYLEKGACDHRGICCDQFFNQGSCDLSTCLESKITTRSIMISDHVVKNGVTYRNGLEHKKISSGLWEAYKTIPRLKKIQRMKKGIFYRSSPVLLTKETDFRKIIKK